jgi:hypothetical protein
MNDEQLRSRLAASDPVLDGAPIHPYESARARSLLEAAMSTEIDDTIESTGDDTVRDTGAGVEADTVASAPIPIHRRPRRGLVAALAVAAVAALAVGGAAIGGAFDGDDDDPSIAVPDDPTGGTGAPAPDKLKVLELSTGDIDPSMMMCIAIDATVVAQSPVAFKATVDTVEADIVTMTVDEWYQGGDAQVVSLTAPDGMQALLGGVEFVPGQQYLVSAVDGVISYCGLSGPATPELQALYDEAFPG